MHPGEALGLLQGRFYRASSPRRSTRHDECLLSPRPLRDPRERRSRRASEGELPQVSDGEPIARRRCPFAESRGSGRKRRCLLLCRAAACTVRG